MNLFRGGCFKPDKQNRGAIVTGMSGPYTRLLDVQEYTTSFSRFAGFSERDLAIGEGEATRTRRIAVVSASYFDFFEARPPIGRFFDVTEDVAPRGADVVVLSDASGDLNMGPTRKSWAEPYVSATFRRRSSAWRPGASTA